MLKEHAFKTGRRYYKNDNNDIASIECGSCGSIKFFEEFPSNSRCKQTGKKSFCIDCNNARKKKYYSESKDSLKYYHENKSNKEYMERRSAWRAENKEHLSEYNKQWHKDNKERVQRRKRVYCSLEDVKAQRADYMRRYRETEEGREAIKRSIFNRRVARNNAPITIRYTEAIEEFKSIFGDVCAFTGIEIVERSVEHLLPVSHGGGNTEYNLIPSELIINSWKTYKNVFEWMEFMSEELDFTFFFESTLPYLARKMNVSVDDYIRWYNESYEAEEDLYNKKMVEA